MRPAQQDSWAKRLLIIAVISIVSMLPAYWNGVPNGNDNAQHFQFVATVRDSISNGDLIPKIAGRTNHGYGDVGLRFYPPLAYYEIVTVAQIVGDWYYASLVTFTLVMFFGGLGAYLLAREYLDSTAALGAAAIYILAPYHLNQIYNNFLLGEFFASAVVPYCFLYLTRLCRKGGLRDALKLAAATSILELTHIPMTILAVIAMAIYALILTEAGRRLRTLGFLAVAASLCAAVTSFHWMRVITELDWVKHSDNGYFSGIWSFRENFLLVPDQIINFSDDVLNLWFADLLLIATVAVAFPTIIYFIRGERTRILFASLTVLVFAIFMTTPASLLIWNYAPLLSKVQFPWRWLSLVSLFTAVTAPFGLAKAAEAMRSSGGFLLTAGIGLALLIFVFTDAFIPRGTVYTSREQVTEQMNNVESSEGCECWWPKWATRGALSQTDKISANERSYRVSTWTPTHKSVHLDSGSGGLATFAAFYYPYWQATSDGNPLAVSPSDTGRIAVEVPEREVDLELNFVEPWFLQLANAISMIAASLLTVLIIASLVRGWPSRPRSRQYPAVTGDR